MANRDTGRLLSRAVGDAEAARDELRRARGDLRRYRGKAAKTQARNRIAQAERKIDRAVARVDKYAGHAAQEERATPVARGESSKEWEVGFSYEGSRRLGNSVMVNFRIRKRGGGMVTKDQATDAIRMLHQGHSVADVQRKGLLVDGVDWRRPGWGRSKSGRPNDLGSFSAIMQTMFTDDFRLGAVKDEDTY